MEKFAQTFKELCTDNNLTMTQLSDIINISDSLLYKYANGIVIPTVENIVKLANYFNCSIDYLLGDESYISDFKQNYDKNLFYARYKNLLKIHNVKNSMLAKKLQISKSTPYSWKNGTIPYLDTLVKIAKYFDVSVDYLVGRSDN